ncbi:Ig-like domain-containing protein [Salinivibrio sp. YCSC6]|uniref:Ig-like domain-containing protein n=1 Tax=Salinivibrio sp. YCSC6 TaxID=2003370 RepID=UPI000BBBC9C6|nr:Ig-like domain-containing protein [Salinivibrio sp. YCSC6]PCE68033.1 hypothetical protein B6G00_06840 [Salinivibrio sp. YCSC6]
MAVHPERRPGGWHLRVSVKVTDGAGNSDTSDALDVTIDTDAAATITVDAIAGDDIVNADEAQGTVTITGTVGGDANVDDTVTLTVNGNEYTGKVFADAEGKLVYSIDVQGSDLVADADSTIVASVSGTDEAGNAFTATTEASGANKDGGYEVDTDISKPTIDLVASSDSGDSDTDNLTNDTTPTFALGNIDSDVAAEDIVVLKDGVALDGTLENVNGTWQFTPSADLADGTYALSVKVTDGAGNSDTSDALDVTIDTDAAATITVDAIAGDDIVNADEAQGTVTITGTVGGDANVDDTVTLTVNGNEYTGKVFADAEGKLVYSIDVQGSDLVADADSTIVASVSGTDEAGNAFTATTEASGANKDGGYEVDTDISKPTIDLVASSDSGDSDTDNLTNDTTPTFALGNIDSDVAAEDIVVLKDGVALDGTLENVNGTWQFTPSADLADGTYALSVKVTDGAGNSDTSDALDVTIDTDAAATITVDAIAGDDIVNADEAQGTVTITGTVGGDANVDDTVTLTVNGNEYTGKVFADAEGKLVYSIDVQGSDLVADADSTIVASVSGTDEAGNAFTATTEASGANKDGGYEVDTDISKPTIDLVASSDSGDSDTDNLTNDTTPTFALGNIDSDVAAEDIVVLKDGVALDGTLENVNGTWQFTPSADLADGTYALSVKVTDGAGNSDTSDALDVTIDTDAAATITVDAIAGDDIVNADEAQGTVTITGTVGGDANVDDTVTLTVNGNEYTGKVFADAEGKLVYSIDVQGSDLVADADSTIVASVSGTDEAGNAFTATTEASGANKDGGYEVDTDISKPTIDLVASSDSGDSDTDNLTNDTTPTFALGNIDSDVAAEDIVVLKDGVALDGTLENVNGTWQFTPSADLADGTYALSVKVTDGAGNSDTSDALDVTIDTDAAATITVDAIAGDDIVNADEAQGTVTITGTVGGDANVDDTVTLTVNGNEYTGKVFADAEGKLVYSIDVQGSDLVADADSTIVASVSGTDEAGNAFTATTEASGANKDGGYEVDTDISKPTIDLVASSDSGDSDTDNLTNDTTPTFALGNIDSDVAAEDIVVLKDGVALDGTLENVNGTWQFTPSADLADGTYALSVKVTDGAGNSDTSDALDVTIDTDAAATITVDAIAGDDIVNADEAQGTVTITGTVGGDANVDDTVTLTVNGNEYTGKVFADAEGKLVYSIDVQGSDLVADADSTIVASVSGTDEAGNAFTATTEASGANKDGGYEVDTDISKPTIDLVASSDSGDSDTDNLTNDTTPTFALGNIDSDVAAEDIVVLKDGVALDGTLENVNGTWQFTPSADLADGTYALSVKVTDGAGNSDTSDALDVTIDTDAAATITVDAIAGDDIVNADEAQGTVTITGTVGGDANVDDTVTLTVNGNEYTGKVFADAEGKLVYSIDVQGSDLVADADSTIVASVSGTDEAGNAFTATTEASGANKDGGYEVDTDISKPTIDLVASSDSGDSDTDNLTNDTTPTFALGNIDSDVAAEDIVVLKDGVALDGTLENVNGTWQFTPSADLADGTYALSVKVTDGAGNSDTSDALDVTIDTDAAATITVDAIAGDDIVNADEAQGTVTITGTVGGDANVDDTVTLTVNGNEYTGKVFADAEGKLVYSIDVQGSDLVADADSTIVASVSGTDEAGNAFTATTEASGANKDGGYEVDTDISKPTIDLVASSDSGDSDTDNLTNDTTPTFALGNIDSDVAAEDIVVLKDGVALDGTLENVNGTWQFTPSADLADGTYALSVKVTDGAGNSDTSDALDVTIDTDAAATITVDAIAGDDIVNADEAQGTVTITGTVGGDANVDDTVTLTVNGNEYTGKVFADAEGKLVYSIDVQGSDLVADADSTIVASVSGTDEAGNAFTATTEASGANKDGGYEVDTDISKPTIDLVASSDSGDSDTDNLTNDTTPTFALGNIDSDVAAEDIVVLKDGVALDGTLENVNGTWQFTPSADLADGTYALSVKVTDGAGNSDTSDALDVTIDTDAAATITVDAIAGDDIVNADEAQGTVTITGTVGGDANVDDTVTLTVNGNEYTGKVFADAEGKLVYSIDVQGSDLVADADSTIVASVSGTDEAGNAFTATTEASGANKDGGYEVDTDISKPTIDLVASSDSGDSDTDNLTNDTTPTFALGNIDSDVAAEDIVVLKDGVALDGTLENVNGTWQFTPSADLADGTYALSVKVTDGAGNSDTSDALDVTIDTDAAATITVDAIAGDDIVNADEAQGTVTITGTVGGDANVDDTVTLTVNGNEYTGKVFADAEGKLVYSIDVQGSDLVADADSTIVASVSGTDEAGNAFTATTEASGANKDGGYEVDTDISKPTIDLVASSDSGDSDTDNLTNDTTPTFALGNIDSDVAAEDIVVLKDGVALDGTLENVNGTWQFTPSADLADGTYALSVKVTDGAGNSDTSDALDVTIDTDAAATITVDAIAGDDIVNADEAQGTVTITGTVGGDANVDDTVTLTVNGNEYTGKVFADAEGKLVYSIDVQGSDLVADADSTIVASVSGTDEAGNAFTATTEASGANKDGGYEVDTDISKPTIDLVASSDSGDSDTDNLTNDTTPTFALGNIDSDVAAEDIVVLKDGVALDGTLENVNGTWQFTPSADLADGTYALSVKVTDGAGNSDTSDALDVTIDTDAAATITVDAIAGDDIVNADEAQGTVTITGTVGGDANVDDTVTLTVNGNEYTGKVFADAEGKLVYSIDVQGSDLVADADSTIVASVSGTDEAGNAFTATTEASGANKDGGYEVDTDISKPTIDLVASSDSGDSDTDNLTNDTTPTFALGNIDSDVAAEDIVVLKDGVALDGTLENVNGTWQFTPSADLADGTYALSVKVTDGAGNSDTSDALDVTIDTDAAATITVDAIAGDDIVNADEAQGTVTITGTVGGDANVDDTVTLTVNGNEYTGKVFADAEGKLVYSIDVQGSDLVADADSTIVASVSGTDEAGNAFTATTEASGANKDGGYEVDTDISKPTIDLVASSDSGDSDTDNLTNDTTPTFALGNIDSDVAAEDIVVLKDGVALDGTLENVNGTWQFTPSADLADGTYALSVKVTDGAGNSDTSDALDVTIDTDAAATITVDAIAGDDIVNADEAQGTVTITGTVGGDANVDDTVTLTVNGNEYTGKVFADAEGKLVYSIDVQGSDLVADADSTIVASVSGTDEAGNAFTATTEASGANKDGGYEVDTDISKPTIDLVASSDSGDSDTDNLTNDTTPTFALGNIDSDVAAEDIVVLKDGVALDGTLENVNGTWQFTPSADLADGTYALSVKVTDGAGNSDTSDALDVTIDTDAAATITVDAIAGDDIVNADEAQGTVTITGTVGGDANVDDTVTLTVNGNEYTGKVFADAEGKLVYSIDVQGSDLVADADSTIVASVSGTDEAGNAFTATTEASGANKDGGYEVDTDISKPTIDLVASSDSGDSDTDNLTNDTTPTFALGNIDSDVAAEDIVVLKDGVALDGTLENVNGTWQFTPSADLADGTYALSVKVTDGAGNSDTSDALDVTIDTDAAATITVDAIAGDDIVNADEAQGTVTITGTVGGDANVDDTVTLTVNGNEYTGKVFADAEGKLVYSIDVQGSDLVADADSTIVASVSGTDEAGNAFTATTEASGANKDGGYEVDTDISKPTIDLVASSDSGDSDTDNLTNDTTPTFALGNIDSDVVTVEVFQDGSSLGIAGKDSNGNWVFTPDYPITAGTYNFTVQVTDSAGNSDISDGLQVTIDTSASASITIDTITDDDVVNEQEASGDVTVTGTVDGDAKPGDTVTLTLQAVGKPETTYTGIVKDDGTYSINVPGSALASDADSAIVASVTGTDKAGNPFTATTSPSGEKKDGDYEVDIDAPNPPVITNITDDSAGSDYSDVTMHGTGEPGATISIYFEGESGAPLAQVTVAADGSWAVELEGIEGIDTNDNVRLEAVQSDDAGNQSEPSEAVHYWHGSWANANTETGDDYVLTGKGNDTVNIITDDANDQLVIDGGAGTDKAVFNTRVDHLSFSKDTNGYLIVENSDTGDRIELRDFETINIDGDEKHIDELFTPTVTISEDANDDGVITANELNGDVDVIVGLPLGASVGDTIRVSDGTTTNEIVLVEADIDNGSVATSFGAPAEGETLTVTAELEDQIGNTSEPGSDSAVLDTQYGGEDGEDPSDIRLPNIVITDSTENDGDDMITNSETAEITVDFGEGVTAGTSTIVLRDSSGNDSDVELQLVWDHNGPRINVINGELDANALTLSGQDGLFTISGIDVSNLQDGGIDAFASFIDQDGNVATNVNGSQWFDDSVVKSFAPVITIGSGVNVSEEGLDGGNADSAPTGTDTTNSPSVSGEFAVTGGVGNVTVALAGGSGLTSNGEAVAWTWDASTNRLIGYTSTTNPVVSIALNEPTPGNEVWTYDVELHGSLDHSDSQTEDTLALPINVVVSDDNHTGLSKPLSVTVEDDSPETTAVEAIPVELQDIPDVLTGKVSFKGQGSRDSVTFDDVTVTALGFANDYNTQLEYDKVNLSSDGIGVDSGYSRYWGRYDQDEHGHPLSNEIEYRITETGQGVSEQLIFSLNGKVAYGAQIEFSKMYGGELESGIVRFYRDGQLIAEKAFTSDEASGDYAKNFDIQEGGFDQITIEATDNGNRNGPDNSDLTVKSITFTGASDQQAIAVADGTLQYHAGADGLGSLKITGVEYGLRTAEGLAITTRFDGNNRLIATDENGALVFEVQLTPATGKWEFYQYQVVQTPEGDADIDFSYQVVDGDGDSATGEFSVQPANVPEPQNYSIETGDGVDQIDMLQSADSGWLALNVGLSWSEKVVINDESFTIDGPETHRMSEFVSDWRVTDNHVIDAGGGDDNVRGGEGDDVLIGGRGSDMLTGSDGADTFSWSMADVNSQNGHEYTDTVSDFSAEDTLNLNDLFKGDSVNGEFSRFSVTVSDDSDNDGTVDVTLKFDYQNKADADQTIELSNVKMEGGTVVINTLIDGERGALTIDKHSDGSISVTSNHDALDDIRIDTDW